MTPPNPLIESHCAAENQPIVNYGAGMRNLEVLFSATNRLSDPQKHSFDDYLIGSLAALVPEEVWNRAVNAAANRGVK